MIAIIKHLVQCSMVCVFGNLLLNYTILTSPQSSDFDHISVNILDWAGYGDLLLP